MVLRVFKVSKDLPQKLKVFKGYKVLLALTGSQDNQALKVQQVMLKVYKVFRVTMVLQVLAHRAFRVIKV